MSDLIEHAKREFLALGYKPIDELKDDDSDRWIQENVLELLRVFSNQGGSIDSIFFCVYYFRKMAMFEVVTPLKGTADEWEDVGSGKLQNKRCSYVFKDEDGKAYNVRGRIFIGNNGAVCVGKESRVYITFPYIPKTKYIYI